MSDIHSTITDLPLSCKSAAEHVANELKREDSLAKLTDSCQQKITALEQEIEEITGEHVALVAYRI